MKSVAAILLMSALMAGCTGITRKVYEGETLPASAIAIVTLSNPWYAGKNKYLADIRSYKKFEPNGTETSGQFILKGKEYHFSPGNYRLIAECKNGRYIAYRSADVVLENGRTYTMACEMTARNRDVQFRIIDPESRS